MIEIGPEQLERDRGRWEREKLALAARALRDDGIVVLRDIVDVGHLAALRERMLADLETILARADVPFNFNRGNVQQDPPPFHPYLFEDVLLNDLAIQVTNEALGSGVRNCFYSGNTALPSTERQPVHPDTGQLWPGLRVATPAFGIVVNVPVVDMGAENGSTEVWPGTHRDTTYSLRDGSPRVAADLLERWRASRTPVQPAVAMGSMVLRDLRLWHAGMPNLTEAPRPMIAMIHFVDWYAHCGSFPMPRGTESFFVHPTLRSNVRFVDEPIDYLHHNAAYDLAAEGTESAAPGPASTSTG